jgi:hypothetical protein
LVAIDAMGSMANRHNAIITIEHGINIKCLLKTLELFATHYPGNALPSLLIEVQGSRSSVVIFFFTEFEKEWQDFFWDAALLESFCGVMRQIGVQHGKPPI